MQQGPRQSSEIHVGTDHVSSVAAKGSVQQVGKAPGKVTNPQRTPFSHAPMEERPQQQSSTNATGPLPSSSAISKAPELQALTKSSTVSKLPPSDNEKAILQQTLKLSRSAMRDFSATARGADQQARSANTPSARAHRGGARTPPPTASFVSAAQLALPSNYHAIRGVNATPFRHAPNQVTAAAG